MFCSLGSRFDEFSAAFAAGGGFGWHRHDEQYWRGSDALTGVMVPPGLIASVLDALGPVSASLSAGGSVLLVEPIAGERSARRTQCPRAAARASGIPLGTQAGEARLR
ncbi:MAG TPA: hypothetical protein VHN80_16005, partial [Kineosporiaceae bacterium]|nr:hypothetical protein [Kineosporiaceae bacterium]